MINKIRTDLLKKGDLWKVPERIKPWTLLEKEKTKCDINPKVSIWKLTWLGQKETKNLEIIEGYWVECSKFEILSRKNDS